MLKRLLVLPLLFLWGWVGAQTQFFQESFETTSGYTFPQGNGGSGQDFFDRTDAAGAPSTEVFTYSGFDGTYFIAGEDIDGTLSGSVGEVLISGINISGQSSLEVTAAFASGTDVDIDESNDAMWVEVRIDGGSWVEIGRFEADPTTTSGTGFNGQFAEDTDFDGDGDGTRLDGTFTDFTWAVTGTGSTMDIRISMDLGSGDEEGAFDNLRISGISGGPAMNQEPSVTNVYSIPSEPTSSQGVDVFAQITDDSGLDSAYTLWGLTSGNLIAGIEMDTTSNDTLGTLTPIPAQADSTIIYYMVVAIDDSGATDSSMEMSYMVMDPVEALGIPYAEGFADCNEADWFEYSVSGSANWVCQPAGYYEIAAFGQGANEDWLISQYPFDFFTAGNDRIYIEAAEQWDGENIDLMYSYDYSGTGDPTAATWDSLDFTNANFSTTGNYADVIDTVDASILTDTAYIAFRFTGTGSGGGTEDWRVDSIYIYNAITPDVTVENIYPQVATANVNQGARDHLLQQVKVYSTNNQPVTVVGSDFTAGGTYVSGDVEAFNLYYSMDSIFDAATNTQLQNLTVPGTPGNKTFSGFSQTVAAGDTGYFFITADIAPGATAGNDVNAGTQSFTYQATVNETNLSTNGGLQTIQSVTPDVTLSSRSSMMGGPLFDTATFSPIYRFKLNVTTAAAELDTLIIDLTGSTYNAGDLSTLRLYQSSDSILDPSTDIFLDTNLVLDPPGVQTFAEFVNQAVIAEDDSAYYFVTVNGVCGFTPGNGISLAAVSSSDLKFTTAVNKSGSASAGGTYTLTNGTPSDATSLMAAVSSDSSAQVSWNAPVGCVDSVMVAVKNGTFTSAEPMPNSTYKADTCFMQGDLFDGGYVVYSGMGTMVNVGCLDSGVTYEVKIWSFNGDSVSEGVTTTVTPIADPGNPTAADAWINEFHYDNSGGDDNEWAEIVVKDTNIYSLGDFSIVLYNGSGGSSYSTLSSADEVTDTSGYIIAAFKQSGSIQNGPDGLALVYQDSIVIQFLSYEGTFLASDGAASGMTSIDIGVRESGSTLLGESLQLQGAGTEYSDFTWAEDVDTTWGEINENQFFGEITTYVYNGSWTPSDPSGISTSVDTVKITFGNVSLAANTEAAYVEVAAGAGLDIDTHTLTVEDSIHLMANGLSSYGQVIGDVSGKAVLEVYLDANVSARWFNIGLPISATVNDMSLSSGASINTLADVGGNTNRVNIYYYNPNVMDTQTNEGSWLPVASGATLTDTAGFSIYLGAPYFGTLPTTLTVQGTLNNGSLSRDVSNANGGWNFEVNPYPSSLNWNEVANDNSGLNETYYVFQDNSDSAWVGYNASAGVPPTTRSLQNPIQTGTQFLAPGQAYFTKANSAGVINFDNDQRSVVENPPLYKTAQTPGIFLMAATADSVGDYTYVGFSSTATDNEDVKVDGPKRINYAHRIPNLYSELLGKKYMYNFVNDKFAKKTIDVKIQTEKAVSMELFAELKSIDPRWDVELEDQDGNTYDLRSQSPTLKFQAGETDMLLHINQNNTVSLTEDGGETFAYAYEGGYKLHHPQIGQASDFRIKVFGVDGKLHKQIIPEQGFETQIDMSSLTRGVYILQLVRKGEMVYTQKITL